MEPAVKPEPRDARFKDPQWEKNPFFDFLKQFYLVTTSLADKFVNEAELDEHLKHKAAFYAKQIANALSPSNLSSPIQSCCARRSRPMPKTSCAA